MAWEYKIVTLFSSKSSSNKDAEQELNELGELGWEAVCPVGPFFTYTTNTGPFPRTSSDPRVEVLLKRETQKRESQRVSIQPWLST